MGETYILYTILKKFETMAHLGVVKICIDIEQCYIMPFYYITFVLPIIFSANNFFILITL